MFDVSGLTEVKMRKINGRQGSYYVDSQGLCVAKTCSRCCRVLSSSSFANSSKNRYNLYGECRSCGRTRNRASTVTVDRYRLRSDEEILIDQTKTHPSGVKTCTSCDVSKTLDQFHTDRSNVAGLRNKCKYCSRISNREYYHRVDENGDNLGKLVSRRGKRKLLARSDLQVASDTKRSTPDGIKICMKCSVEKDLRDFHRTKYFLDGHQRFCKPCSNADRKVRLERKYIDYWYINNIPLICYVCSDPWEHSDHVIARKHGGSDDPHNRLPICQSCNLSKFTHYLEDWLRKKHPEIAEKIIYKVTVSFGIVIQ